MFLVACKLHLCILCMSVCVYVHMLCYMIFFGRICMYVFVVCRIYPSILVVDYNRETVSMKIAPLIDIFVYQKNLSEFRPSVCFDLCVWYVLFLYYNCSIELGRYFGAFFYFYLLCINYCREEGPDVGIHLF